MASAGSKTKGQTVALPLARFVGHRKLVAAAFPRLVGLEMEDASAAAIQDQKEMFHSAASQGMLSSILALLADKKLSHDLPDRFGRTPLHWAAEQGRRNVVLALLKAGACVDRLSRRKATPIMLAASSGHVAVVRLLLRYFAGFTDRMPVNPICPGFIPSRGTALHCAAAGGHLRTVELLLGAGFNRGQQDREGLTPAEISAKQSHSTSPAITRLLLPRSDRGGKLLYNYVNTQMQDVVVVSGLAKGGAFLDWQDGDGETPLHRAVHFRHFTVLRVLLQAGADPDVTDDRSASPLHVAASTKCGKIVDILLEAGADMELVMERGLSPLHMAVTNNRLNIVRILLNAGASKEHRDAIHGQTPLSWACRSRLAPIARALVAAGANVESRCLLGLTPLHWACRFNSTQSVKVLLKAGADPGAVDRAAADARAIWSSVSGTSVSRPIAIDVIGLGCPLDHIRSSMRSFPGESWALAARRSDLVTVRRIMSALRGADQKRSWRRRGWLVVLASRRSSGENIGAAGDRRAIDRCGSVRPVAMPSPCVDALVKHPTCPERKEAASDPVDARTKRGSSDFQHPQKDWTDGSRIESKRLKSVDNMLVLARGPSRQQRQSRGGNGSQANAATGFPELLVALLGLAAVEVGVFRRVVMFV